MITLPFQVGISPSLKIRGLIATKLIKKNQIIEKCPLILIDIKKEKIALQNTVLWKYYYEWTNKNYCLVLGYGSLINHSYSPNAVYKFDYKHQLLVYKSIQNIFPGQEITVNYNWNPNDLSPLPPELVDFSQS